MGSEYATRPRERIARILRSEHRYLTAADIHRRLSEARENVALSTVYRTLERLLAKGVVVSRTDSAGEAQFVFCQGAHHHHAICRRCGKVEDVDCAALEQFADSMRAHSGFQLQDHAMEFFGTCAACS